MNYSLHPLDNKLLLGRYRVIRLLGEGGMGTVHLARVEGAEGFTRPVVVKRMKRDMRASDEGNRLFIREAKILSKMQHPGIVGISDFGVEEGAHIMVLEYVHGYTLSTWVEYRLLQHLPLPVDICLFILRRVLDALQYAHHFGAEGKEIEVVHRDISPDNVLLSDKGYVHLLDFGIASMSGPDGAGATNSGAFRGKLCYGAPELVHGQAATPRSDQYSAAVLLYELLTAVRLFEADSVAMTFVNMVNVTPQAPSELRPEVPAGLDAVILRALDKDPLKRFESVLALSRELRKHQTEDDEEVSLQLRRLVANEFELLPQALGVEPLRARQAALDKSVTQAPLGRPEHEVHGLGTAATLNPRNAAATLVMPGVAPARSNALLLSIAGIGVLIALGLGVTIALLSRGPAAEVVVVGGERSEADLGARAPLPPGVSAEPAPSALATSNIGASTTADVATGAPTSVRSKTVSSPQFGTQPPSGAPAASNQSALSQAVAQKSGAFQACFTQHLSDTNKTPQATLHFSVAKQGGNAQVEVEPAAMASSALGRCLGGAARQVQFPPLEDSVSFRVPVRARVTSAQGG
jgi:serine/threonine protein kinase